MKTGKSGRHTSGKSANVALIDCRPFWPRLRAGIAAAGYPATFHSEAVLLRPFLALILGAAPGPVTVRLIAPDLPVCWVTATSWPAPWATWCAGRTLADGSPAGLPIAVPLASSVSFPLAVCHEVPACIFLPLQFRRAPMSRPSHGLGGRGAPTFRLPLLPSRRRWPVNAGQPPVPWCVLILEACQGRDRRRAVRSCHPRTQGGRLPRPPRQPSSHTTGTSGLSSVQGTHTPSPSTLASNCVVRRSGSRAARAHPAAVAAHRGEQLRLAPRLVLAYQHSQLLLPHRSLLFPHAAICQVATCPECGN